MIQSLNKKLSILFKFSTYSPPKTQSRIIKSKRLPHLQNQSVNLNKILQKLMLNPFEIKKEELKDNWQYEQAIHFLNQISNLQNLDNYLRQQEQFNIFQCLFQILSKKTKFTKSQQQYLSMLMTTILKLYVYSKSKGVNIQKLSKNIALLNKYFMLTPLNINLIVLFMKFSTKYRKLLKNVDKNLVKYTNDKFVFDYILQSKHNYTLSFITLALSYCAANNIQLKYHERNQQINRFFIERLPKQWPLKIAQQNSSKHNKQPLFIFLKSYLKLSYFNSNMIEGAKYIVKQNLQKFKAQQICCAIKLLLQWRQIRPDNIKQFMPLLKNLILKEPAVIFQHISTPFYLAGVWENQFWIPFFDWLKQETNFQLIGLFYIYSIYSLMTIDKDLIPKQIIQAQIQARKYLLKNHNFSYEKINSVKQLYKNIEQQFNPNMTIQKSFTNNMRLVSQLQIRNQVLISLFFVDILIGDKTVIEVNNSSHYKHNIDTHVFFYNLKSEFRKRVLKKLGYRYFDIDVFQISQGSFQLIKNLYDKGIISNKPL